MVQRACGALGHALVTSARCDLPASAAEEHFAALAFPKDSAAQLAGLYAESLPQLRALVAAPALNCAAFHTLSWRLDVRLASRSTRGEAAPSFLLRVVVSDAAAGRDGGAAPPGALPAEPALKARHAPRPGAAHAPMRRSAQPRALAAAEAVPHVAGVLPGGGFGGHETALYAARRGAQAEQHCAWASTAALPPIITWWVVASTTTTHDSRS